MLAILALAGAFSLGVFVGGMMMASGSCECGHPHRGHGSSTAYVLGAESLGVPGIAARRLGRWWR